MNFSAKRKSKTSNVRQYVIAVGLVASVSLILFWSTDVLGYRVVALILLMIVSFLAMFFDILPVVIAAVLSATIWNLFFIPPIFTFHIENADDNLLFLMYFIIALVHGVLTFKIREAENIERDKAEKERTILLYNTLLNSLSHELRTPISAIIGAVDLLNTQKQQLSAENVRDLLSEIDIASMRLNRQVENLLNMSRLETGMLQLKLDWTDLNELIFRIINKIQTLPGHHRVEFVPNVQEPLCKVDAIILEEVLYNLLNNAILYTPEGTDIKVATAVESGEVIIRISDNGNGFPELEIPHVFDKFYRLPNSKAGGTGLGLSIVKGFVEAHSGTIQLQNNPLGGAVFTIELPCEISYINNLKNE